MMTFCKVLIYWVLEGLTRTVPVLRVCGEKVRKLPHWPDREAGACDRRDPSVARRVCPVIHPDARAMARSLARTVLRALSSGAAPEPGFGRRLRPRFAALRGVARLDSRNRKAQVRQRYCTALQAVELSGRFARALLLRMWRPPQETCPRGHPAEIVAGAIRSCPRSPWIALANSPQEPRRAPRHPLRPDWQSLTRRWFRRRPPGTVGRSVSKTSAIASRNSWVRSRSGCFQMLSARPDLNQTCIRGFGQAPDGKKVASR